jgi:hypothetical protein
MMRTEAYYRDVSWPLLESSLWLRAGILSAGVSVLAVGTLVTTEASFIAAAWAVVAAVVGALSLRRAWRLLDEDASTLEAAEEPRVVASPRVQRAALLHG